MKLITKIASVLIIGLGINLSTYAASGEESKKVAFNTSQTSLHIQYDNFDTPVQMTLLGSEDGIILKQNIKIGITENVVNYSNLDAGEYIVLIEENGKVINHYSFTIPSK